MKKTACMILVLLALPLFASAVTLDEIQKYGITVNMRNDGTMDIYYRIEWRVLDDKTEGPLSWVKIGMPNQHVDQVAAHTGNIKKISFTDSGGYFVRVDFDRSYYKNEVITFEFSIHESRMYTIDEASSAIRYTYTPGWFDDIEVKAYAIRWGAVNVRYSDSQLVDGGYLIWCGSLQKGKRVTASIEYDASAFDVDPDMQYYQKDTSDKTFGLAALFAVLLVMAVFIAIFVRAGTGAGQYRGGFYGGYIFPGFGWRRGGPRGGGGLGGSGGGCACASSCACACACAGAGGPVAV